MKQIKETLYGEPKNGTAKQWSVYVEGDKVVVEWGRVGGKLQTKETICTPKNIGRSNETTSEQQALLEAEAKWTKQHDNKLYRKTIDEAKIVGELLPMLAIDGSKKPEKIKFPCYKQPKLDGVRCMVYLEDEEVKAISRQGKFYELNNTLKNELKILLTFNKAVDKYDGELYIDGQKLQNIVSAVRNTKNPLHEEVEFNIFDIPMNKTWEDRMISLHNLLDMEKVKIVRAESVYNMEEAISSVKDYMEDGYEGTILRNLKGKYEFNHRSNDLIKLKVMQDSEAKVISCREDKNGEGVLTCAWNDVEFDVKMKGSHEERLFEKQNQLIGSWINFSYQALTDGGKPQFPVGNYIRNCDENGEPLE